ncbi:MAG: EAL domain-containing protein [Methylotenera sp.]|uniref:bifunctional diguanylate cyclase/phosphodiesterase n=1 Tax=Methylotenera sp. TaxID=2051956 RepID=UPI00248762D8|nr:EAL domain-containing protein [Methylotenera sp.]MDI1307832.1 EAL domain-containing protein [Methylotenera sp.]
MINKISTIWRFILPVLILLAATPVVLITQQTSQQLDNIEADAHEQAKTLVRLINVTDEFVTDKVDLSMRLLTEQSYALGAPSIDGDVNLEDKIIPNLIFGSIPITHFFKLVDELSSLAGGTSTIFVKNDHNFVRVSTNVLKTDMTRATGTILNPNSKAFTALSQGQIFHGVVDILDEPYITRYDPMYDTRGAVIGAYYVGYKVDMKVIRDAIQSKRQLKSGFAMILDGNNKVRFHSAHVPLAEAERLFHTQPEDWIFATEEIPNWGFKVIVTYPVSEARALGLSHSWLVIITGVFLGTTLLIIILWQLRRLIVNPIGGDPALAIDVVKRIADGDFDNDGLEAKPNTLMSNVLSMRDKLRESITALRESSESMLLSASVFEHAHDGIMITDVDMNIIRINPAFSRITGYSLQAVLATHPKNIGFVVNDPKFFEKIQQESEYAGEWRGEAKNLNDRGESYDAWIDIFPVRDDTRTTTNFVCLFSDITESKKAADEIEHLAFYDSLTHLANRRMLIDRLKRAFFASKSTGRDGALLFLDLDHFKMLNDSLGHDMGDLLLQQVAARLTECLREGDTIARVARLGGDEFVVMLEDLSIHPLEAAAQAEIVGQKILATLNHPYQLASHEYHCTVSIGVALFGDHVDAQDDLVKHADIAMYQAKRAGRNTMRFFDPLMQDAINTRADLERELRKAIDKQQFQLYYQIQVDQSNTPIGAEALIRWIHPERGMIPPGSFICLAEETGLILPIGEWVLDTACAQIKSWQIGELTRELTISINVSAKQFYQNDFVNQVQAAADRHGINPSLLKLELTESMLLENIEDTIVTMTALKEIGIRFSLDDFGTGYSSLQYLKRLPLTQLKIDQSFVRDIAIDSSDKAIVRTIIAMAKSMELEVIAEGVETKDQQEHLLKIRCKQFQGYLFGKPIPIEEFEASLNAYLH